jgi:hypothetical protein
MGAKTWIAGGAVVLAAAWTGCERQSWDTVKEFHRHHAAHDDAHGDPHGDPHAPKKGGEAASGHGAAQPAHAPAPKPGAH